MATFRWDFGTVTKETVKAAANFAAESSSAKEENNVRHSHASSTKTIRRKPLAFTELDQEAEQQLTNSPQGSSDEIVEDMASTPVGRFLVKQFHGRSVHVHRYFMYIRALRACNSRPHQ
jgi:hypothetical protein